MDTTLALADAYQRLLGELSRRLGAARAELLLRIDPRLPAQVVARCENASIPAGAAQTLEIPISEGAIEVGRLRIEFAPTSPLPQPSELSMAQALVELATLLIEDRHQHTWGLQLQAGRRMLAVTEEELQRIILDIHDGPVQKLFAVSSHLALVQARLEEYGDTALRREIKPIIERMNELMESALQEIRATLSGFRLAEFEMRPLQSVLRGLAMQHEALTGNQVALEIENELPQVELPVKIALYRVLQEALSNSYRHAGVDRHEVRVRAHEGWIELIVVDEGRGFDPPPLEGPGATERQEHIGLRGMRERVHLVGGQLQVLSRPGHGTRVIVRVPAKEAV